jgi:hypothetical protein
LRRTRRARQIIDRGEQDARHEELINASLEVNRQLRRKPWEFDVIWAADREPPSWVTDWQKRIDYRRAHDIYRALEELAVGQARQQVREQTQK